MTEESGEAARSLLGHTDAEVLGKPMAQLSKMGGGKGVLDQRGDMESSGELGGGTNGNGTGGLGSLNTSPAGGTFFGMAPSRSSSTRRWNPFRKTSGIMAVMHAQTKKGRLISKHGRINTYTKTEEAHDRHRLIKDFFTSTLELDWSWTFFSFAVSFFASWLFFAIIWYLIIYIHGDLTEQVQEPGHEVCITDVQSFTACFLYSVETQHTIGYGGRAITEQCPAAMLLMCVQSIVGVIIQACMAGIVFAKFMMPMSRGETIIFSKNALITMRNGALYLLVRIADLRMKHLIECHVNGHFLMKVVTEEGEEIPNHMSNVDFGSSLEGYLTEGPGPSDYIQPFWPLILAHKIDWRSPLYTMSPKDLQTWQFEVIVTLEGVTPETGCSVQARTSYLPSEIVWGQRFEHKTVVYDQKEAKYAVSYTTLNTFVPDNTPRCSAQELDDRREKEKEAL